MSENRFEKYLMYNKVGGKVTSVNMDGFNQSHEALELLKELYDTHYGSIEEDENLVAIHTGGWSENESLIEEFMETSWWRKFHKITSSGGHYYFDTDFHGDKKWKIIVSE